MNQKESNGVAPMECLFVDVAHVFTLPIVTPDGLEIFNPQNEKSSERSRDDIRRRSSLGLRTSAYKDTAFMRAVHAFADGLHFHSGQTLRSYFLDLGDGCLQDYTSDIVGWSPRAFAPADDAALAFAIERLPALMPLNLNDTFSRVSNALRLYDLGQDTQHPDLALMSYVSALEGLFSVSTTELSFRLSLTISKFLEQTSAIQQPLFGQIRDLYTVRSKLSHGDKLCTDEEQAALQLVEYWVPFAAEIAWRCFRKLLEKNLIETFNDRRKHEAFLESVVFS
jgi:hypothetical protein